MDFELTNILQFPERLQPKDGYWQHLTPEFEIYLKEYLRVFEKYRREIGVVPAEDKYWKRLPFGPSTKNSDWKWRRQSLSILKQQIKNQSLDCTLEIGAWNGWLSKYLASKSKTVIAADYFSSEFDGVSNLKLLAQNIIPLQCNLAKIETDFANNSFDLIVLNHCLSYSENPVDYIKKLLPLLKVGGRIISIGNTFFKNPEMKIRINALAAQKYHRQFGMELYIQAVKGYMDFEDMEQLRKSGFQIKPYNSRFLQNAYALYKPSAPYYTFITYQQ